ncbi:MAG TPA: sugar phosphate isomerase/epimerase family protein [Bryobacteraceae bacterium]|nr:sugar phosphate isomerase/epimerase family protein [Bryobacteraceae bacterium]
MLLRGLTRRELLAAALATALARAAASKTSQLAAINDEIGLTPEETTAFAKKYGVQWLEMRGAQIPKKLQYYENLSDATLRETKKRLADEGLRVSVLDSSLLKFTLPGTVAVQKEDFYVRYFAELGLDDATLYRTRLDMLKRTIAAAHALGTRDIRIFSCWRVADPAALYPRISEILAEFAEVAGKENCRLLIENETSTNVATSGETAEMMRLVPSPALGINWDPQNSVALEPLPFPDGYSKLPKARIANVHVKAEGLFGPKHPLDWGAIMHAMLNDGYTGRFTLETHRGHNAENVRVSHECMEKMVKLISS